MENKNITKEISLLEKSLKREKSVRFILLFVIFVLGFAFATKENQTKIVLQPVGSKNMDIFVTDNEASKEYLKSLTEDIVSLRFLFTPETVDSKFDRMLSLVHPKDFPEMQKFVVSEAERIKKNNLSSVFYPQSFQMDVENKKVALHGRLINYSGDKRVLDQMKTYRIDYIIQNGTAMLEALIDATGSRDPMSIQVKTR